MKQLTDFKMKYGVSFVVIAAFAMGTLAMGQDSRGDEGLRLNRLLHQAMAESDYESAIDFGLKLAELFPEASTPAYNLACAYSLDGDQDVAMKWFRSAARRGFYFLSTARRDDDLDRLRKHAGFEEVIGMIRRNNAEKLKEIKPRIERARLVTYLPPSYDAKKPAPLVVVLHGSGGRARNMADAWREAVGECGAILVAPQAMNKMGDGFQWGVVEHAHYQVLSAIRRTKTKHLIDDRRIILAGFSQGATVSLSLAFEQPDLVTGVVAVAAFHDQKLNPVERVSPDGFPRFSLMIGALDIEAQNNRELSKALEKAGVNVDLRIYPGVGHALPPNKNRELLDGLRFVLTH